MQKASLVNRHNKKNLG